MTKQGMVDIIASKTDMSKKKSLEIIDLTLEIITSVLKEGGEVTIAGFGKFVIVNKQARTCRNPSTGATMQVPAKRVPAFRAALALKKIVAG